MYLHSKTSIGDFLRLHVTLRVTLSVVVADFWNSFSCNQFIYE